MEERAETMLFDRPERLNNYLDLADHFNLHLEEASNKRVGWLFRENESSR
jgi:hypothetical protein